MHLEICDLFKINPQHIFDPHMTLFCTDQEIDMKIFSRTETHQALITDKFILSLGESDDIGQLTKIIFK